MAPTREQWAAYRKKWVDNNPDKHKASQREYYERNREQVIAKATIRNKANPKAVRNSRLKNLYGITSLDYEQMFNHQSGICAVCWLPPKPGRRLVVDHCHSTDEVRGLLCRTCNSGIGLLRDSPVLTEQATIYLRG